MSGIKLESLEVSDMLDVLHYLFEQDAEFSSEEQMNARSAMRDIIYESVYDRKYAFSQGSRATSFDSDNLFDDGSPISATTNRVKPYIPPTPFNPDSANPYGGILRETPLG